MKNIIPATMLCGVLLSIALLHTGCRKEMFMPEPEGGIVPYKDSVTANIQTLLKSSPYKLFYTAWQRSNMEQVLTEMGRSASVTLLVADDAAMKAAGMDEKEISKRTPEELDELIKYHMLREKMEPLSLQVQQLSTPLVTLLSHPSLREQRSIPGSGVPFNFPYDYRHYFSMAKDSQLIINGKPCGHYKPVAAKNGILWPVNRFLRKPEKHIKDILEEDPRFTMLRALHEMNNQVWMEVSWGSFARFAGEYLSANENNEVVFNSYLAPTDEAFRQAGIESVAQIREINSRFMPELIWDPYGMSGLIPTDSVLDYHNWARMYAPRGAYGTPGSPTVFYSNDLYDQLIGNYMVYMPANDIPAFKMPLQFIREGNVVKIKVKGAKAPAATVTEADINTLEGPLHIVDRLLLPDGFKVK